MQTILQSQHNFRDLGGIPTKDGRFLKPGMLYRSGDLFPLSPEDIRILESMGLAMIIDLRARREIDKRPDKVIPSVRQILHIDIHDAARDKAEDFFQQEDAEGLATVLVRDYRRLVNDHQGDFSRFLDVLAKTEHLPLVYHCAAGKDRTGLATVFLLAALGVDMEMIRADYLATNDYALTYTNKIIRKLTENGQKGELLRPLLEVRDVYLDAAMEEIHCHYKNIGNYISGVLHADCKALQERFLTK